MATITGQRLSELQTLALGSTGTLFYAASANTNSYKISEVDLYNTLYTLHLSGVFQPKNEDWRFAHKTGTESITGAKTFVTTLGAFGGLSTTTILATSLSQFQRTLFNQAMDIYGDALFHNDVLDTSISGLVYIKDTGNTNAIHISNRLLSGTWSAQKLQISGVDVLTGGAFLTVGDSGALSNRLYQTGSDLIALINSNAAGVSTINNASGIISLTGRGNVTVISGGVGLIYVSGDTSTLYPFSNPNNYATSGNLTNTGATLYNLISNYTGYANNNPSGYLTSNTATYLTTGQADTRYVNITGHNEHVQGLKIFSGVAVTGYFSGINFTGWNITALNSLTISGHPVATGNITSIDESQIVHKTGNELIHGLKTFSGVRFTGECSGINITGHNISALGTLKISGNTVVTGGPYYPNNNPSGFITATQAGGVQSINSVSGALILQGSGDIGVYTNGNVITIYPIRGLFIGSGSPEGILVADSGSVYTDWFERLLYHKVTGSGAYGWI